MQKLLGCLVVLALGMSPLLAAPASQQLLTATDAQALIQSAYSKVVVYGQGDIPGLKFEISNVRILYPEDFATFAAVDEETQTSGMVIRASPVTYSLPSKGVEGARLELKWETATEQEEEESAHFLKFGTGISFAQLAEIAMVTDPLFAHVDRVAVYHVHVSSKVMERGYEAAFVWATDSAGVQRVHPQDYITGGVSWAMNQLLPPVHGFEELRDRSRHLSAMSIVNSAQAATTTTCTAESHDVSKPNLGIADFADHQTGQHSSSMTMFATCTASADCTSHCSPFFGDHSCVEFGSLTTLIYKHVPSTDQKLLGGDALNAASNCQVALGCAVTKTLYGLTGGVGFSVTFAGTGLTLSPTGPVLANLSESDNAICPAAVPITPPPAKPPQGPPPNRTTGPSPESPILVDLAGNGFDLTGPDDPVSFDLDANGTAETITWTAAGSDEGFLCLDRNGNGSIDSGAELFGNATPLHDGTRAPNGYVALREFDLPQWGGNGNGVIDAGDAVFPALRIWVDSNHDGISEPQELRTLEQAGITRISFDYIESRRRDRYGNQFRFVSVAWKRGRLVATSDVFFLVLN